MSLSTVASLCLLELPALHRQIRDARSSPTRLYRAADPTACTPVYGGEHTARARRPPAACWRLGTLPIFARTARSRSVRVLPSPHAEGAVNPHASYFGAPSRQDALKVWGRGHGCGISDSRRPLTTALSSALLPGVTFEVTLDDMRVSFVAAVAALSSLAAALPSGLVRRLVASLRPRGVH